MTAPMPPASTRATEAPDEHARHNATGTSAAAVTLASGEAAELAELLLFLCRWFKEDEYQLEDDFAEWTGGGNYRLKGLRSDLSRSISVLGFQRVGDGSVLREIAPGECLGG